jgi:hypothetical protein
MNFCNRSRAGVVGVKNTDLTRPLEILLQMYHNAQQGTNKRTQIPIKSWGLLGVHCRN